MLLEKAVEESVGIGRTRECPKPALVPAQAQPRLADADPDEEVSEEGRLREGDERVAPAVDEEEARREEGREARCCGGGG